MRAWGCPTTFAVVDVAGAAAETAVSGDAEGDRAKAADQIAIVVGHVVDAGGAVVAGCVGAKGPRETLEVLLYQLTDAALTRAAGAVWMDDCRLGDLPGSGGSGWTVAIGEDMEDPLDGRRQRRCRLSARNLQRGCKGVAAGLLE